MAIRFFRLNDHDRLACIWRQATTNIFAHYERAFRRILLLALLYLLLPAQALLPVSDPDLWWHLRTGQWIIQHGAVPHTDPFSSYGFGEPWIAYSWLFELTAYRLYAGFDLLGIVWFTTLFGVAISLAIHLLVRRGHWNLAQEVILTAAILVCIKPLMSPRSWLFSILFFTLLLYAILDYRQRRDDRALYWLPVLFLLWSNLHIQFVYGLAVLFIVILEPFLERLLANTAVGSNTAPFPPPSPKAIAIAILCLFATTLNPYGIYVYKPIWEVIRDTKAFDMIMELQSLSFRSIEAWVLASLLFVVVFCVAKRGEARPFPFLILSVGIFLSFRARRDIWVGALTAAAVLTDRRPYESQRPHISWRSAACVIALVAMGAFYFAQAHRISEKELAAHLATEYPVGATNFIKQRKIQGPVYNHYNWGGFLIWSLPGLSVSIDGRSNLHTEDRVERSRKTWWGLPGWSTDPDLIQANVIVAPNDLPLTTLLKIDSRFKHCYEDQLAVVFVPARQPNVAWCE